MPGMKSLGGSRSGADCVTAFLKTKFRMREGRDGNNAQKIPNSTVGKSLFPTLNNYVVYHVVHRQLAMYLAKCPTFPSITFHLQLVR